MRNFSDPLPGQPVGPFVADSVMWANILEVVRDYQAGELGSRTIDRTGKENVPAFVNNRADNSAVPVGSVLNLAEGQNGLPQTGSDSGLWTMAKHRPTWERGENDANWPDILHNPALAQSLILPGETKSVNSERYIVVSAKRTKTTDDWVMVDPTDVTKLVTSDAGIYKIIAVYPDDPDTPAGEKFFTVDTYVNQPIWKFEIIAAYDGNSRAVANLYRLDGDAFATVQVTDILNSKPVRGYCKQIGKSFIPFRKEAETIFCTVDGSAGARLYNVTPVHALNNPDNLPQPFVLDMTSEADSIQPMYPGANGMVPSAKDIVILTEQYKGFGKPFVNNDIPWKWIGTQQYIARYITGTLTLPAGHTDQTYTETGSAIGSFWDGVSPGPVTIDFYVPSILRGCENSITIDYWGAWKPEDRKYEVISTKYAMLGAPTSVRAKTGPMTLKNKSGSPGDCTVPDAGQAIYEQNWEEVSGFQCAETGTEDTLTIDPAAWDDCFKDAICDLIKEHCDLCEWICQNCEGFAKPDECVQCEGSCTWTWNATDTKWESISLCDPPGPECGCGDPPSRQQIIDEGLDPDNLQDGDRVLLPCEELPPIDCDNCTDCGTGPGSYAYVSQLSATVTSEQGGTAFDSWTVSGPVDNQTLKSNCVWQLPIEWSSGATGCATASYQGPDAGGAGQGKWTITVDTPGENGVSGDWTSATKPPPPAVDCSVNLSGDDIEQGGKVVNDFGYITAAAVTTQIGICPFNSTDTDCGGGGNVAVAVDEAILNTDSVALRVIATAPEIVSGCSCKRDVLEVMRRWTPGKVTDSQIMRVAETISTKTKKFTRQEIFDKIKAVSG